MTTPTDAIEQIIEPSLSAIGFRLIRVRYGGGHRPVLQIMVEPQDGGEMDVENCAEISRVVSALLDVEDPIKDSYTLEVSSPGIDRPLVTIDDFARFAGHEAKIELNTQIDGRRRFKGRLLGAEGDRVMFQPANGLPGKVDIRHSDIADAKLVLTDELIEASLAKRRPANGAS